MQWRAAMYLVIIEIQSAGITQRNYYNTKPQIDLLSNEVTDGCIFTLEDAERYCTVFNVYARTKFMHNISMISYIVKINDKGDT